MEDNKYPNFIGRGRHAVNDKMFDLLAEHIEGKWLDVGCNIGVLLSEIPDGTGVDLAVEMVERAKEWGLNAIHADARNLPFEDDSFDTVVLSCVLEQIPMWQEALDEAVRVCRGKVIGINPIPDESAWGRLGGTEWVKSVIDPEDLKPWKAKITYPNIEGKYFFEIKV
jgi:ubiquinone/menaquinone biosynthesis C-methylase UbiE